MQLRRRRKQTAPASTPRRRSARLAAQFPLAARADAAEEPSSTGGGEGEAHARANNDEVSPDGGGGGDDGKASADYEDTVNGPDGDNGEGEEEVVEEDEAAEAEAGGAAKDLFNLQVEEVHEGSRYTFIYSGYRAALTHWGAVTSIFKWHNETMNIWTHLLPFLVSVPIMVYVFVGLLEPHGATGLEVTMFVVAALGIESVFFCSSLYHTMGCVSYECSAFYSKFDFTAIAVKIVCGGTPILYTAFYCSPVWQIVYISLSYVLGAATVVIMCIEKYSLPKYLKFRVGLFISLGASMVVPLVHRTVFMERGLLDFDFLFSLVLMGAMFIGGALLYAHRFPERLFPRQPNRKRRWIDHVGHSHNIFHVAVVIGGYLLVKTPFSMFESISRAGFLCD